MALFALRRRDASQGRSRLKKVAEYAVKGIILISVTWTFFCGIMLLRGAWEPAVEAAPERNLQPAAALPSLPPATLYHDLPGITESLAKLNREASDGDPILPTRVAVVFQPDSTCFVELTYVRDCGCPESKLDRYELVRDAIDPMTGNWISRQSVNSLSAERVAQFHNDFKNDWRSRL